MGTKVFLREENSLYTYYKDKGYHVFSFERDLKSFEAYMKEKGKELFKWHM